MEFHRVFRISIPGQALVKIQLPAGILGQALVGIRFCPGKPGAHARGNLVFISEAGVRRAGGLVPWGVFSELW